MLKFKYTSTLLYLLAIVGLNVSFSYLHNIAFFGQSFSPADMVAGVVYLMRDFAQREVRHYILIVMAVGMFASYVFALPAIALASVSAFAFGETIDWAIFTWTHRPLSQRLLWSSLISVPMDTCVFLFVAGRFHWGDFSMMNLGKFAGVMLLWTVWKCRRV